MKEALFSLAQDMPPELGVAFLAALPITELRGSIPFAMWVMGMPWWKALLFSLIGNLIPVPLLLWGLEPLHRLVGRTRLGAKFFAWLYKKALEKGRRVEELEELGLFLFVAIPLPGTGAWTGSLVAAVLGLRFWRSATAIALGVLTAGAFVTLLSAMGLWGAGIAAAILLVVLALRYGRGLLARKRL